MPNELREKGRAVQTFDTEDEAVAGARELIRTQPDSDPEIWDTTTGKPAAPRVRHGARVSPARSASDAVRKVRQTGGGCGWLEHAVGGTALAVLELSEPVRRFRFSG